MDRKFPFDDGTLRMVLHGFHVTLPDVDTLDDHAAFLRIYLQNFSSLTLIVPADDNDIVVFLDMQLDFFDPCFHFSLI